MSTPAAKPRRALRRRLLRLLGLSTATAALVIGILSIGLTSAPTASAFSLNPLDSVCEADQSLALPEGADNGSSYTNSQATDFDGFTVIQPSAGEATWRDAGDGLTFVSFGLSMCHDAGASISTTVGSFLWQVVAVWPAKIVGIGLDLALSGALSSILLGLVQEPLTRLYGGVYLQWAPLVASFALTGILWRTAARKGKPLNDFGWLVTSIILTGIMASPTGIQIARTATEATGQIATCAAIAPMGGCVDGKGSVSDTVMDGLLQQSWGAASLGDIADTAIPTTITLNAKLKDSIPDIRDGYVVTIPTKAIPAGTDGSVSYSDALRWTYAYTDAEASKLYREETMRCSFRDRLPAIGDVTGASHGDLNKSQLCGYKALVRAAILSDLATEHPGAYAAATGRGGAAIAASLSALFGLLPLMIGVSIIAGLGLIAEVELVLLVLTSPVVGLASLRNATVARKWGQEVAATIVKRVGVGISLGLCLWGVAAITAGMTKVFTGAVAGTSLVGLGIAQVAPKALPVAIGVTALLAMVGAFKLLTRIQSILLAGLDLHDDGSAKRGQRLAASVVGAAAGAMGAPSALAAGLRGGAGSAAQSLARTAGRRGRTHGKGENDTAPTPSPQRRPAPVTDPIDSPTTEQTPAAPEVRFPPAGTGRPAGGRVGPAATASAELKAAWAALARTAPAVQHRQAHDAAAQAHADEAATELRMARDAALRWRASALERARIHEDTLVRQGATEGEARSQAGAMLRAEAQEVEAKVVEAQRTHDAAVAMLRTTSAVPTTVQHGFQEWAETDAPLTEVADALGLKTQADQAAFEHYRQMVRREDATPAAGGSAGTAPQGGRF